MKPLKVGIAAFADCILKNQAVASGTPGDALRAIQLVYRIHHVDPAWRQKFNIQDPSNINE